MNECPKCGFNEEIADEPPYRGTTNKEKQMPVIKKSHEGLKKFNVLMSHWFGGKICDIIVGIVSIVVIGSVAIGASWLLFPGIYYLGDFINSHFIGWNINKTNLNGNSLHDFYAWWIGIALVVVPVIAWFAVPAIGRGIRKNLLSKKTDKTNRIDEVRM